MEQSSYKLIIFDLDGTLTDFETRQPLEGVKAWFEENSQQDYCVVTNQGGVGLRYWMERDGFGDPKIYPTEEEAYRHIQESLMNTGINPLFYVCFAYQTRQGKWCPVPPFKRTELEWQPERRKPAPGMLLAAMTQFGIQPEEVLMVGDREEDQQAAERAGCHFQWAKDFFGREE